MSDQSRVIPVAIEDEVKESYLNYAMSVIVSRALPDVRDGLKPVHRRILYGMNDMGIRSDQPPKKSARIVGDVMGRYHPHGDASLYDTLVRLTQPFSMRYPMIQGQGNFGSVDGDPPAAMRYTEARLHRIADDMLRDIKKETVDFAPNYDDSLQEPEVLPGAFPFLLCEGASGIAVGMATNIPPHNLNEIARGIEAYIDDPEISISGLMKYITGPDFPTGGTIYGVQGIRDAYHTGKGKITVRSRFTIESTKAGKDVIIVHEIPYMVNKATLIMRIADLVRDRKVDGISDLRDESDRNGMRIVIELKKSASPKIILNHLFSHTQLQQNFNVNALALVNGRPEVLNLKEMIRHFVAHRREVVIRRAKFDLDKAEKRAHILEGLRIALENIDEVIKTIKESRTVDIARTRLMERFEFSEIQATEILNMRLQRLTSLETQKILDELAEVMKLIEELKALLASEEKILEVVKNETLELVDRFGDERRTDIVPSEVEKIDIEDLIQREDMVVLMSHRGYTKRVPWSAYKIQGRGGKGMTSGMKKDDDFIEHLFIGSTHDYLLFVSSAGRAFYLKVHEIPEGSRYAKGTHVRTLLQISADEEITAVVSLKDFTPEQHLFMATARGVVKKVTTDQFTNARTRGITAIKLDEGDRLKVALLTSGDDDLFLVTRRGRGLRFHETSVRAMGRPSRGVSGIKLTQSDELAGCVAVARDEQMMTVTEYGYGKRTNYDEFTPHGRGTGGQIAYGTNERTGELVDVLSVDEQSEMMIITSQGQTIKLDAGAIPVQSRSAMGVRVVDIAQPDYVVGVDRTANSEEEAADAAAEAEDIEEAEKADETDDSEE
ncbi:MAG TPA: DNA topoisomerase (ATP-hydrolyzing) subunit A [Spirochaetia bacterium]|nr:DNA topoisomerase (ATP-hydrolyzing) subunit A [Spirochaetia bacterium]